MSADLVLKPTCSGCGSQSELYGSTCKHLTLCVSCGKTMAQNHGTCNKCGAPITRLIREYNVRACSPNEKNYFIGRFATGLPNFSKKKNENKWCMQKEGLQGRQVTDALREKFKNKPWLLEDESGQSQYHGQPEGAQSATYYLLMLQGREFVAIPAGSWYNFNKVAQYKQLTLEEAEEKMNNRRKTADGYQRWMMKAANNGPAAFGEAGRFDDKEGGGGGGKGKKKSGDDEGNASDQGEEDEDEDMDRKRKPGRNKKGDDDDEEGPRGGDLDDEDDIEKGDDWEHEEIFTDDDEAPGNDPEEREDLAPEVPVPPEIKQDDEDEEEGDGEGGWGLSESGKELKKILGKVNGMNESDPEDDDEDEEDDDFSSPVLQPEGGSSPAKASGSSASKLAKGKRKANGDEPKPAAILTPSKKAKPEMEVKAVKEEVAPPPAAINSISSSPPVKAAPTPVTEEEIRAVLLQQRPVTTSDLVNRFKSRLKSKEDKNTFAAVLRKISRIQKTGAANYVVLRERTNQ